MKKETKIQILTELWGIEDELDALSKRVRDAMRTILRMETEE